MSPHSWLISQTPVGPAGEKIWLKTADRPAEGLKADPASLAQQAQGFPCHCSKPETDAETNCWQVYGSLCCVSQWHKECPRGCFHTLKWVWLLGQNPS